MTAWKTSNKTVQEKFRPLVKRDFLVRLTIKRLLRFSKENWRLFKKRRRDWCRSSSIWTTKKGFIKPTTENFTQKQCLITWIKEISFDLIILTSTISTSSFLYQPLLLTDHNSLPRLNQPLRDFLLPPLPHFRHLKILSLLLILTLLLILHLTLQLILSFARLFLLLVFYSKPLILLKILVLLHLLSSNFLWNLTVVVLKNHHACFCSKHWLEFLLPDCGFFFCSKGRKISPLQMAILWLW